MKYMNPAEQQDRLHRMEPDKRAFVDKQEDQSAQPAEHITKQGGDVLLHSGVGLLAVAGRRRIIAGRGWLLVAGRRRGRSVTLSGRWRRRGGMPLGVHRGTATAAKVGTGIVIDAAASTIWHSDNLLSKKSNDFHCYEYAVRRKYPFITKSLGKNIFEHAWQGWLGFAPFKNQLPAGDCLQNLNLFERGRVDLERIVG